MKKELLKGSNAFYAQSGGVTAVINATACGVIETARQHNMKVYAGKNGIMGALREELIDTSKESNENIAMLNSTPGGAFGSCRYKLQNISTNMAEYERIIQVFAAHNIGYFFYNGGGDSHDTAHKISQVSKTLGYPITCIGIPKTIDNDLPFTDCCPGFGSLAKYLATSIREVDYDLASMSSSSTKIFVLEVMGRHTGWPAAAAGLAKNSPDSAPHLILFPEIIFDQEDFLKQVALTVKKHGRCSIVVSEGLRDKDGRFIHDSGLTDAFGHIQLGGIAPTVAKLIKDTFGYKHHWAVADYLQRSARHIASKTDLEQAYALGKASVEYAVNGETDIMTIITRKSTNPYTWGVDKVPLAKVANVERKVPRDHITKDGYHITKKCRDYIMPLIQGEDYPQFIDGLPNYIKLKNTLVPKKLPKFDRI